MAKRGAEGLADGKCVVMFSAKWSPPAKQMEAVFDKVVSRASNVNFVVLDADEAPSVAAQYKVSHVPTFLFLENKKAVSRLEGASAPKLVAKVQEFAAAPSPQAPASSSSSSSSEGMSDIELNSRLKALINRAPVMLFMKGNPDAIKCKFSRKAVETLQKEGIAFSSFDILTDPAVRQGLKEYSNWPTYPQLYVNGALLGGIDILTQLAEDGELKEMTKPKSLDDRLKELTHSAPVIVFMKGHPSAPRCGFSRKVVELLNKNNCEFSHFDILTDDEVRQGLKKYSNWPTFPQVYHDGALVGGLDVLNDLEEEGELKEALGIKTVSLQERLQGLIDSAPVMLFMKGDPDAPRCGFSRKMIDLLRKNKIEFGHFDILTDEEVRQGLKAFSNWPTFPQVYAKGTLVGGLDVLNELEEEGELVEALSG